MRLYSILLVIDVFYACFFISSGVSTVSLGFRLSQSQEPWDIKIPVSVTYVSESMVAMVVDRSG